MSEFAHAVAVVLQHEGGLSDDPLDAGGTTKYGISLRYLQRLGDLDGDGYVDGDLDQDGDVDSDDVREMALDDAKWIYKRQWWERYGYGRIIDQSIATKVFDLAVNMGPGMAHRLLQRALNRLGWTLTVDGAFGPKSVAAVNVAPATALLRELRAQAAVRYAEIVCANPPQIKWLDGWMRRAVA